MPRSKKVRGRPSKQTRPAAIPDSPKNVIKSMFRTRSKSERDLLNKQAENTTEAA